MITFKDLNTASLIHEGSELLSRIEEHEHEWSIQAKINGWRCLYQIDGVQLSAVSRHGNSLLSKIPIGAYWPNREIQHLALDCELIPGRRLYVLDDMDLSSELWFRLEFMAEQLIGSLPDCFSLVPTYRTVAEGLDRARSEGHEGLVFKHLNSKYNDSNSQYKLRFNNDIDCP